MSKHTLNIPRSPMLPLIDRNRVLDLLSRRGNSSQRLWTLGEPHNEITTKGYGATVWANVDFADTYYQTRGLGFLGPFLIPIGRPIPGAYNRHLTSPDLPNFVDYNELDSDNDHSAVWNYYYLGS